MCIHIHTHKQAEPCWLLRPLPWDTGGSVLPPRGTNRNIQDTYLTKWVSDHSLHSTHILPGHCSSLVWRPGRPGHYARDLPSILAACEKWKENTYSFGTYCDNFLTAFIASFSSLAAHFIICLPLFCTGCKGGCPLLLPKVQIQCQRDPRQHSWGAPQEELSSLRWEEPCRKPSPEHSVLVESTKQTQQIWYLRMMVWCHLSLVSMF